MCSTDVTFGGGIMIVYVAAEGRRPAVKRPSFSHWGVHRASTARAS